MPETNSTKPGESVLDLGALIHSSAGIIALILGALMYAYNWALPLFASLMILSAVSAVWITTHSPGTAFGGDNRIYVGTIHFMIYN